MEDLSGKVLKFPHRNNISTSHILREIRSVKITWSPYHTFLRKSSWNQRFYLIFHTVCTWCYELTQFLPLFFHFFLQDPKLYVSTILDVHRKYNALVMTAFNNDSGFVASLDKACGKFINNNSVTKRANASSKSPELLAKYCDLLLKKSSRNPEEAELEDTLNQVVSKGVIYLKDNILGLISTRYEFSCQNDMLFSLNSPFIDCENVDFGNIWNSEFHFGELSANSEWSKIG